MSLIQHLRIHGLILIYVKKMILNNFFIICTLQKVRMEKNHWKEEEESFQGSGRNIYQVSDTQTPVG